MTTEPSYTDTQIDSVAKLIADKCGNGMREKYEDVARQIVELLTERQAAMQGQGGEVKRFDTSAEDRFEQFIQAEVDRAPEPLRRLGEYLARVMDDDQFKTAERMLLGIAAIQPPQPVRSVSYKDVMTACRKYYNCGHPVHPPVFEGMRAALEHFAAIAQERQS